MSSVFWLSLWVFWSFSEVLEYFAYFRGFNGVFVILKFFGLLLSFWGCFGHFLGFWDILDIRDAFLLIWQLLVVVFEVLLYLLVF